MTGTTEDPENHTAVAATVFSAVVIYAVGCTLSIRGSALLGKEEGILWLGIKFLFRVAQ